MKRRATGEAPVGSCRCGLCRRWVPLGSEMHRLLLEVERVLPPGEDREPWQYHALWRRAAGAPTVRWVLLTYCDALKRSGVAHPLSRMPRRPTAWAPEAPRRRFRLAPGRSLRGDQREAVAAAVRNLAAGKRGGHMLMPPGWGKTWVALSIAGGMGEPCAFLMQSTELLVQFMLTLFRDFDLAPPEPGSPLEIGAILNEGKAKELGDFQRHINLGTGPGGFAGVRMLFASATALRHLAESKPHLLESIRGMFPTLYIDEAHQVAPSHEGGEEESSMLIQSIEELVTPTASVLAFTQGFDRQDGFVAYLNTMFRWCPEVQRRGGVLHRAYHCDVGRTNFTLHRLVVQPASPHAEELRRSLRRQAREHPASTDFLEKLSWQLEENRMAVVFATVARQRAAGRTVMLFLDYRAAVYAYAEMMLASGSNLIVMTGSPSEDRQQVAEILQRLDPTAAATQEAVQRHTVATREELKARARRAGRTSAHRQPGELPLGVICTKAASVGLDLVEASSVVVVSSCDAARQRLQQIAGRTGREVTRLEGEKEGQLIRSPDPKKSSLVTLLHCPRRDYVVHDAAHTESHREAFFHDQIWESLRASLGHCRCGRERQACPDCAALCRGCGAAPVAASMPRRMLCRGCLGGEDGSPANANVCYLPSRVVEEAAPGEAAFADRLAAPTFAEGEEPSTTEEARRRLADDLEEARRGRGSLWERLRQDSGGWHDPLRVEASLRAGHAWLDRMEAAYAGAVLRREHVGAARGERLAPWHMSRC